jgi:hypothetical protein
MQRLLMWPHKALSACRGLLRTHGSLVPFGKAVAAYLRAAWCIECLRRVIHLICPVLCTCCTLFLQVAGGPIARWQPPAKPPRRYTAILLPVAEPTGQSSANIWPCTSGGILTALCCASCTRYQIAKDGVKKGRQYTMELWTEGAKTQCSQACTTLL